MARTLSVVAALLIVAALSAPALATTQLVANGNFWGQAWDGGWEGQQPKPWSHIYDQADEYNPWGMSYDIRGYYLSDAHDFFAYTDVAFGNFVPDHNGNPTIQGQQGVNLTANTDYTLSADLGGWTSGVPGQSVTVHVDLVTTTDYWLHQTLLSTVTYTDTGLDYSWHSFSTNFTIPYGGFATNGTNSLAAVCIRAETNTGVGSGQVRAEWDNVSLLATVLPPPPPPPIPEPITMSLVGMGIVGLGGYIRRRMATK